MTTEEISQFVADVDAAGLSILGFGQSVYLIFDGSLPQQRCYDVTDRLAAVTLKYGKRDHLSADIVAHLNMIGRFYTP